MHYRDYLQQLIYKIINPVVKGLIKMGITPNIITTTGLILNIAAAVVFYLCRVFREIRGLFLCGIRRRCRTFCRAVRYARRTCRASWEYGFPFRGVL